MPYEEDPIFSRELDNEAKIWRYVDFAKFVDLLERSEQYFVRANKLVEIDPYEGYFNELMLPCEKKDESYYQVYKKLKEHSRIEDPKLLCISCWHVNQFDSDAMWKLYATRDRGIAIQTTIKNLKMSFRDHPQRIDIAKVKYIDYSKKDITYSNLLDRFSTKGISFEHEHELRLFVLDLNPNDFAEIELEDYKKTIINLTKIHGDVKRDDNGIYVKVDLNHYLENVIVSPLSPEWFVFLVKSIVKKYGLRENVVTKSKLYEKPKF